MSQITFTRKTNFTGRNGYFKASGLDLCLLEFGEDHKTIMIAPLTSRGEIARCDITIPFEDVPDLIRELQALTDDRDKYRVKLLDGHYANEDQIIDGYLGNLFGSGEILTYTRGIAIKKARQFRGKIEKVTA